MNKKVKALFRTVDSRNFLPATMYFVFVSFNLISAFAGRPSFLYRNRVIDEFDACDWDD